MSVLRKLFGNAKKNKGSTPSTEDAIQKLRLTEELMEKKQEHFEKKIEHETAVAKQNAATNKRASLLALKRKKMYEKKLSQIDNTILTLEQQREALESARANTTVLNIMKDSADTLKSAHKNMKIDDVHDIMDDVIEENEISEEISKAISHSISNLDEDELLRELEELQIEELEKTLPKTRTTPITNLSTPAVPTFEPSPRSRKKIKNNDELNRLADWAS